MDIRMPGASLNPCEHFLGMPKRGLALLLANVMFWQPLWAQADGIAVSGPGTTLGQAGNGVPIVNIAAPNGSGLSHNQFSDYNVGQQGVILNNATNRTQSTQLGGIIFGNPNLKGNAANIILNEVTGGSASQLRGYTEVAGQSAKVIVANPYGITCNGCGFINTPNVTLTTGKPVLDNGRLDHYQVDGGAISIDGQGLNASNVGSFEIITRAAQINAQINANQLSVVAGRNDVDAQSLKATVRADDGSAKPQLAIDSSALGGMYAGAIRLVSTEAGVGVKLDGTLAASGGDIQLDANGHLSLAQTAATGAVNVKAVSADLQGPVYGGSTLAINTQGDLNSLKTLAARDNITLLSGGQLTNNGIIESGVNADNTRNGTGDASLTAQTLNNTGNSIIASRNLTVSATQAINNQGGTLSAKQTATLNAGILDNQSQGRVLSTGNLNLTANQVLNAQGGLITSSGPLTATVGDLNNRGGEVSSLDAATLTVGTLDNVAGLVTAGSALKFSASNAINNQGGKLTSQGTLDLKAGAVDNSSAGRIASQRALTVQVDQALVNTQGLISSEDLLSVSAASLANRLGSLSSAGLLSVNTVGALDNQGGQLVTDGGLALRSASLDNSQKGTLSGASALSINTGAFDNSQGTVSTRDTLDITAGQLTNQNGGRLTSSKALTASVSGLDQQSGTLFSETSVSLDLNQGQLNNQDGLINAPLLMLKNLKGVNNQGGEISSAQAFTLTADSLDNSNGKLLSNQALTLRVAQALTNLKGMIAAQSVDGHAASLDNSGGTLTSRGDLLFNADDQLNNQNNGLIRAANTLTLNSAGINNQNGSLLGSAIGLDFGNTTSDLNNAGGLITTAGQLTIAHLRDLNNQGGEISSSQSLNLAGRTLDNSQGKLISNNQLTLNGTTLINQGGLISGWQGVSVTGTDLDNRNGGTVSSRYGNVDVHLSNVLQNTGSGALVSQKDLTVTAASLDNSDKGIVSSGGGQTLTVSSDINNSQGGLINSGAALDLNAQIINNNAGAINAQQALTLTGSTLDNTHGALVSNGAITLDLTDVLTNTNGKLASGADLLLKRASQINNQGGQLASQGLLTLLTGGLDNRHGGTVSANNTLTLKATGVVQNSDDGLIASQKADLIVQSASLDNAKGSIQSQTALGVDVAGAADNQSGKLIAQAGDVTFKADSLDNRGGTLASLKGDLEARTVGVLRNGYDLNNNRQGGTVQGQNLKLITGSIDNYGGRMAAQTGDAVVSTGSFDNRNGGLYAKRLVSVTGGDFDNSGTNDGQIAGQQITLNLSGALNNQQGIIESDSTLNITAASLDNQKGQVRALGTTGKTVFQIGGLLDNRNGTLEVANQDLDVQVGSFQNAGGTLLHVGAGTLGIAAAALNNAGGSVITRGGLTIDQDTWANNSLIQAGRLTVKVNTLTQDANGQLLASDSFTGTGNNWTTAGLIASDGTFDLTLAGNLNSTGRTSSLSNFNLSAAQLDLSNTASLAGGGVTTVNLSGTLNNSGRLTSAGDLNLNAGTLNNYGTLGSGQKLTATTGALLNDHGLIFSGGDMSLRVNALNNQYADIYSLGNLSIDLDGQGGLASSIINSSSSIQSDGNLSLAASTIQNIRAVLTTNNGGIYTASINEFPCQEGPNYAGDCDGGKQNHLWQIDQRDKTEVTQASAASSITSGGSLTIKGGELLNASSSVGAASNLNITVNNLSNTGIVTGETETSRIYVSERTRDASDWYSAAANFNDKYSSTGAHYNANDLSGLTGAMASFIGMTERERTVLRKVTQISKDDQRYAAVIQAGGTANVNVQGTLNNSVVRPGYTYVGSGSKTTTDASGANAAAGYSTRITLNQQLPPDRAQQQINPLSLPGFSLPTGQNGLFRLSGQVSATPTNSGPNSWTLDGNPAATAGHVAASSSPSSTNVTINHVQGVPDTSTQSRPQKYLIETNPALTDLKQFMSSDYLLSNLGYNPDTSWKRLGDGLYEQRLVEQAVVARTGQRFIDGQTSNEDQFKYLMNNAIQSKQQLNLAVGVSLTAEQVAALTHDIVWMETAEVNGEQVLVPVLYLAQANNRLAPNGALIAGNDVNLIAGKDLENVGTLRATNNLSAQAGQNVVNSGLVEAGNRLDLLAGGSLVNTAGGIIAGRDVSLTATQGDVVNERSVTSHQSSSGYRTERTDFVDSAARIEAANSLTVQAGRDVNNTGGVIKSGSDTSIKAERDVNLIAAEQRNTNAVTTTSRSASTTQYGSTLEAGRDLSISAGRDITAVASQIDAKRDVTMAAAGDLTLASAANEQHSAFNSKKVKAQEDHVSQVATTVTAGGDVALSAGADLNVVASSVKAADEAYLYAGKNVNLLAAENKDYSFYSKTKKGSWGKKSSKMSESENDVAVSSTIEAGKKVVISGAQDINAEGAKVSSGDSLLLNAGHDVNLNTADNYTSQANASSKKGLFSSKSSRSSSSQSTVTSTELQGSSITVQADNDVTMNAAALKAQQAVKLSAGRDIEIGTAEQQQTASQSSRSSKFGFNIVAAPSLTQKAQSGQQSGSQSIGTSISADSLDIQSARDTAVRGSTLVTDNGLRINAGRNLDIVSAEDQSASSSKSSSKKAGEIGSWWQDALGVAKLKDGDQNANTRQAGSQVASLGGDVSLTAGEHYNQVASQVIAPKGDISITAKDVDIQAGFDVLNANHTASASRTAIGGSIDIPLLDAARGVQQAVESAGKTSDPRMQGLAAANAAMSGKQTYDAAQEVLTKGLGFKVSVSLSNSESHSDSSQSGQNVVSSSLAAGGDINVTAKGAGKDSVLNVVGSRIDAGRDVKLKSDGDINLLSAQNTAVQKSTNGNSGGSVGIGFTVGGAQNGLTLDLAANKGMGMSDGHDVTQTNTSIKAGNKASLDSGKDTNLKGAVVTAKQVQADVGGDLNLSSLQDTSKFSSKQVDSSVGVSICIPPFCYGVSGTASFNQQKMKSDYASVSEQTGIKAGDGGFQVDVKGNTDLNGAIIASSDQAVKDGKNTLSTGTLTSSDIKNKAAYDASSIGLSGGMGEHIGRAADGSQKAGAPGTPVPNNGKVSANAPIALLASGDESSMTRSGISGAAVTINDGAKQQALTGQSAAEAVAAINTDVSSDRDGSNKLKTIFNPQEIQVGFDITAKFVQNVGVYIESKSREADALRSEADKEKALADNPNESDPQTHKNNYLSLNQQARDIENDWGAGGTYRQIATALVAGVSGNVGGSTAQFAQNMVVNYVQQQGSGYIGKLVAEGLPEGSPEHAALHAILGCAGAAASNQSCSAGALAGSASSVLAGLFATPRPDETNEEREAKRNIITSLVTGIAAITDPNAALTANNTATANVDNNWLADAQKAQRNKELSAATSIGEWLSILGKWDRISAKQGLESVTGFGKGFTEEMASTGIATLDGAAGFMAHPLDSIAVMNAFLATADGQKILGDKLDQFKQQLDLVSDALEKGGDTQSEQLGRQLGGVFGVFVSAVAGSEGSLAKGASILSKAGIDVSASSYEAIAAEATAAGIQGRIDKLQELSKTEIPNNPNSTSHITDSQAGVSDLPKIGSLTGEPEVPKKNGQPDYIRSIERQNEAARKLAQAGYDVEQLPEIQRNGSNPDLKINGELADVYSPITSSPISVLKTVAGKVLKQAPNVVVYLADSPISLDDLSQALAANPVSGLKKLYIMKNNEFRVIEVSK